MRRSRRSEVDPFIVMDVMAAAAKAENEGRHIIHMEVGQPGTPAPKGAREHLAEVMENEPLGYTVALGLPELRDRISQLYKQWYSLDIPVERIVVTSGSSGAFILAFTALFDAGDRVALGLPGYPSYRQILKSLDLEPVAIQTSGNNRFQPVPEDLIGVEDLAGLIVASPSNPSGTILNRNAMTDLIDVAQKRSISFVSDEIYHGIDHANKAVSALEISDDVYVINSFSKYFSMTGWRVGWMVVPQDHVRTIERLAQNLFICPSHAAQIAAIGAMDCGPEVEANLRVYSENRRLMIEGLSDAGFSRFAPPDGAFYVYVDVSEYTNDSLAFAAEILEKADVSVTPGLDFDPDRGHRTLRLSYARSTEDIVEGLARLKAFMAARN